MNEPHIRIIDANLNRAREALRVIEDHARFVLDDGPFAKRAKALRHSLLSIAAEIGPRNLLEARDSDADVGRDARTATETLRGSAADVAAAAFGRLSEAARSIAEFGKLVSPDVAESAERIRFESYALQSALTLRGEPRRRLRAGGLYVIITEALCRRPWVETVAAVLRGGAGIVQLREKELGDRELLERAALLRQMTRDAGALLFINDRPDIARLAKADGVHVGQDDLAAPDVRRIAGPDMLVGLSTHTREQIDAAGAAGPDYIAVGPMFASSTKPQSHVAGVERLRYAARVVDVPLMAIGGLDAPRAPQVRDAGAAWVCICAAIIGADDAERATREISSAFRSEQT